MWNSFGRSFILLLINLAVLAVSKGNNVRSAEGGMHQKLQADQSRSVSITADGRLSAVRQSETAATVNCENITTLEGCMCDSRRIGTGITGNFVNDSVTFDSFMSQEMPNSFWEYTGFQYGEEVPMKNFKKGKLTLVANVASA